MSSKTKVEQKQSKTFMSQEKIVRHHFADRLFHWLFAIIILTLLLTGLLPPFGVNFSWVTIHWVAGVTLIVLLIIHILRSLVCKNLTAMLFSKKDFSRNKPGKYSIEQKLMHNFLTFITFAALVTGALMMVRIDTPFWERNPFWLQANSWGLIYVIHGLMALVFVSTLMLHIYFALRPEKRLYLRSMIKGWITKEEYLEEHDPELWAVSDDESNKDKQ